MALKAYRIHRTELPCASDNRSNTEQYNSIPANVSFRFCWCRTLHGIMTQEQLTRILHSGMTATSVDKMGAGRKCEPSVGLAINQKH